MRQRKVVSFMHHIQAKTGSITRCLLLSLLLCACSCQRQASSQAHLIDIPLIKQKQHTDCGLACLEMLYSYYGQNLDQISRDHLLQHIATQNGLSGHNLLTHLKRDHFQCFLFKGNLSDRSDQSAKNLLQHLYKNRPLILLLKNKDLKHYVLLHGAEPDASYLYIKDPANVRSSISQADLLALWSDRFSLLAIPKPTATKKP